MGILERLRWIVTSGSAEEPGRDPAKLRAEVVLHFEQARYAEAAIPARALVEVQRAMLGERHPDYATALSDLATVLQRLGDSAGATVLLDAAVKIRREILGEGHPETTEAEARLAYLRDSAKPPEPESQEAPRPEPQPQLPPSKFAEAAPEVAHALEILDRVLALEFTGPGTLESLVECHETARRLHAAITEGECPVEAERLVRGDHAFVALLNLAERRGRMSDAEWADAHQAVCAEFGRSIASAASRDRLRVPAGVRSRPTAAP